MNEWGEDSLHHTIVYLDFEDELIWSILFSIIVDLILCQQCSNGWGWLSVACVRPCCWYLRDELCTVVHCWLMLATLGWRVLSGYCQSEVIVNSSWPSVSQPTLLIRLRTQCSGLISASSPGPGPPHLTITHHIITTLWRHLIQYSDIWYTFLYIVCFIISEVNHLLSIFQNIQLLFIVHLCIILKNTHLMKRVLRSLAWNAQNIDCYDYEYYSEEQQHPGQVHNNSSNNNSIKYYQPVHKNSQCYDGSFPLNFLLNVNSDACNSIVYHIHNICQCFNLWCSCKKNCIN